jgi:hypothetical protein
VDRTLEQGQFARILLELHGVLTSPLKESPMNDPAAGQGQIGLDRVQLPTRYCQHAGIAAEP